jgi:hypothetical protein
VIELLNKRIYIASCSQVSDANELCIPELAFDLVSVLEALHYLPYGLSHHSENVVIGTQLKKKLVCCLPKVFACVVRVLVVFSKQIIVEKPSRYDMHVFVLALSSFVGFEVPI